MGVREESPAMPITRPDKDFGTILTPLIMYASLNPESHRTGYIDKRKSEVAVTPRQDSSRTKTAVK